MLKKFFSIIILFTVFVCCNSFNSQTLDGNKVVRSKDFDFIRLSPSGIIKDTISDEGYNFKLFYSSKLDSLYMLSGNEILFKCRFINYLGDSMVIAKLTVFHFLTNRFIDLTGDLSINKKSSSLIFRSKCRRDNFLYIKLRNDLSPLYQIRYGGINNRHYSYSLKRATKFIRIDDVLVEKKIDVDLEKISSFEQTHESLDKKFDILNNTRIENDEKFVLDKRIIRNERLNDTFFWMEFDGCYSYSKLPGGKKILW